MYSLMIMLLLAQPGLMAVNADVEIAFVSQQSSGSQESADGGSLIFEIVGFESNEGQAVVSVIPEDEWTFPPMPGRAGIICSGEISGEAAQIEISGVPSGKYVAIAFHDADSNGEFDPETEQMGFFGDIPQMGSMQDPPSFDDLCFEYSGSVNVLRITVQEHERPSGSPPGGGGGPRGGGSGGGPGGGFR